MMMDEVKARAAKIKVLLMDVDGVLTDGKLYFIPDGVGGMVEFKAFDSQDGIGLQWCAKHGIRTGVISGRNSPATVERAKQAKMTWVYQGHTEKIPIIEGILAEAGVSSDEVAYMGDDLTDVVCFHRVGLAIAVANARPEVKQEAHWVTTHVGGDGAVRDAVELILDAQGLWDKVLKHYEARRG
jgi:3-deoxy-D-manno-octulosonate 8-phosphate phosphatase (KDO 8-P phosphatase)